jgi:orotidine 5'-phosphate decarboxylase subfamily 1
VVQGLAAARKKECGVLLIAEMSSASHLMDKHYIKNTLSLAEEFPDFVFGFIAQRKLSNNPGWLYLTPGIQFDGNNDSLGQQYISPEKAILEQHSDIMIVGRGIITETDMLTAAQRYRTHGWQAYKQRCQH